MLIEILLVSLLSAAPAGTKPSAPAPKPAEPTQGSIAPEVKPLVERMQSFYEKTQDFKASFKQDYKYKTFNRTRTSTGTVLYKKPALMRWEYESPGKTTYVLTGNKAYIYSVEAESIMVLSLETSKLSPSVSFLLGRGQLAREFNITQGKCADCKGALLVLDPVHSDPRFTQVRLEVDSSTGQVLKSTVVDPDGAENTISFLDLKTNVKLKADSFKLNPPEGTRVDDFNSSDRLYPGP
ncbi:LolA family protein [Hyalangium versicolor]|uniref:LolA family protein n=1 Tax=Hyalangium versicolor TaxID=2861190 RepID=UPI001CCA8EBA|nr:outer membrane lipoprotein carrier protein LolA [Hyalangium versicolor]